MTESFIIRATNACGQVDQPFTVNSALGNPLAIIGSNTPGQSFATYDGTTWVADDFWSGRRWYFSDIFGKWVGQLISPPYTISIYNADRTVSASGVCPDATAVVVDETADALIVNNQVGGGNVYTASAALAFTDHSDPAYSGATGVGLTWVGGNFIASGQVGAGQGRLHSCPLAGSTWTQRYVVSGDSMTSSARTASGAIFCQWRANRADDTEILRYDGTTATVLTTLSGVAGSGSNNNSLVFAGAGGAGRNIVVGYAQQETENYRRWWVSADSGASWSHPFDWAAAPASFPRWNTRLGKYLGAVSPTGTQQWMTSVDGITWTPILPYLAGQYGSRSAGG